MNRRLKISSFILLSALLLPAHRGQAQTPRANEEFHYRWQLRNFVGVIASLFLPHEGDGSLTFKTQDGHLRSELTITSSHSQAGEYWRYGSEVDARTLEPIRAWSSYSWRGRSKSKNEPVAESGVFDVAAGIYAIRRDPPAKPRRMEIWSDGDVYPVVVVPLETEMRQLARGRVPVRHYSVRGVDLPGRKRWKGKLDLWLTRDESATPIEILISRNLADLRLQLQSAN
jgi:uncharacterized protein DUF3108